jgi:hypothetical protein
MLTGNLLRASRGLLGINQTEIAASVGLSVSAIQRLESSGHDVVRCSAARAQQIEDALKAAGVSILNGGRLWGAIRPPGARQRLKIGERHTWSRNRGGLGGAVNEPGAADRRGRNGMGHRCLKAL